MPTNSSDYQQVHTWFHNTNTRYAQKGYDGRCHAVEARLAVQTQRGEAVRNLGRDSLVEAIRVWQQARAHSSTAMSRTIVSVGEDNHSAKFAWVRSENPLTRTMSRARVIQYGAHTEGVVERIYMSEWSRTSHRSTHWKLVHCVFLSFSTHRLRDITAEISQVLECSSVQRHYQPPRASSHTISPLRVRHWP